METREQLLQALEWEALLASPRLAPLHLHPGPPKPAGRPFAENQQPPPPGALCPVSPRRSCSLGLPLASIDELEPLLCDAPVPAMPAMAGAQAAHMVRNIAKLRPGGALTPSDNTCMLGKDAAGGCYPALQRAGSAGAPPQLPPLPPLPPIKTGRAHSAPDALPALQGLKKIRTPRRHFGTAC